MTGRNIDRAYAIGHRNGAKAAPGHCCDVDAIAEAYRTGREDERNDRLDGDDSYAAGRCDGLDEGYYDGHHDGFEEGTRNGQIIGHAQGVSDGFVLGHNRGVAEAATEDADVWGEVFQAGWAACERRRAATND